MHARPQWTHDTDPYEYVDALRQWQGPVCRCGRCEVPPEVDMGAVTREIRRLQRDIRLDMVRILAEDGHLDLLDGVK